MAETKSRILYNSNIPMAKHGMPSIMPQPEIFLHT